MCGTELQRFCIPSFLTFGITAPEITSLKMGIFPRYNKAEFSQGENTQTKSRGCLAPSGLLPEGLMLFPQVTKVCLGFSKNWVWPSHFNFSWTWKQPAQPFQPQAEKTKSCWCFGDVCWDSGEAGGISAGGRGREDKDRVTAQWQHGDGTDRELQGTSGLTDWRNHPPGTGGKGFFFPYTPQEHFTSPFKSLAFCFAINVLFSRKELRAKLAFTTGNKQGRGQLMTPIDACLTQIFYRKS